MADFARWTAAACPALGWDPDRLLAAYADNRAAANETTLDASPLVAPLRRLGNFEGSATALLAELVGIVGEGAARSKVWPKSPSALSGALRRLAPNLRRAQPPLEIEFDREGRDGHGTPTRRRLIRVGKTEWVRRRPSTASTASTAGEKSRSRAENGVDGIADGDLPADVAASTASTRKPAPRAGVDGVDDVDGDLHTQSGQETLGAAWDRLERERAAREKGGTV